MTFLKWTTLGLTALMTVTICAAQQKFPLRPGEWTATVPDTTRTGAPPMTMLYCMNDAEWAKALNHNPICSLQQVTFNASGGSYSLDCKSQAMQMKGSFKLTFDGMTHMTNTGTMEITFNGQTTHSSTTVDFRWKGPDCNPNADANLRDYRKPRQ
jgi:hypothetical protein